MAEHEKYPEASALVDSIARNEDWSPVYRAQLEEVLKNKALRAALKSLLVASDEQLKNVGLADLTDEGAIKKCLRLQGVSDGLTQAVELLCEMASTPESREEENE